MNTRIRRLQIFGNKGGGTAAGFPSSFSQLASAVAETEAPAQAVVKQLDVSAGTPVCLSETSSHALLRFPDRFHRCLLWASVDALQGRCDVPTCPCCPFIPAARPCRRNYRTLPPCAPSRPSSTRSWARCRTVQPSAPTPSHSSWASRPFATPASLAARNHVRAVHGGLYRGATAPRVRQVGGCRLFAWLTGHSLRFLTSSLLAGSIELPQSRDAVRKLLCTAAVGDRVTAVDILIGTA